MTVLGEQELQAASKRLGGWSVGHQGLKLTVTLADFKAALALVNRAGEMAEEDGHHPDIDIRYNRVTFLLVTHDAGGVTEKDVAMAERLDTLVTKNNIS
jgi:4a-hydroxytetrahydrobiopterin dehydratase